jgi:hypothetical protein
LDTPPAGGIPRLALWSPLVMALAPVSWANFTVVSEPLLARYHAPVLMSYTTVLGLGSVPSSLRPDTIGRLVVVVPVCLAAIGEAVGRRLLAGGALVLLGLRLAPVPARDDRG